MNPLHDPTLPSFEVHFIIIFLLSVPHQVVSSFHVFRSKFSTPFSFLPFLQRAQPIRFLITVILLIFIQRRRITSLCICLQHPVAYFKEYSSLTFF